MIGTVRLEFSMRYTCAEARIALAVLYGLFILVVPSVFSCSWLSTASCTRTSGVYCSPLQQPFFFQFIHVASHLRSLVFIPSSSGDGFSFASTALHRLCVPLSLSRRTVFSSQSSSTHFLAGSLAFFFLFHATRISSALPRPLRGLWCLCTLLSSSRNFSFVLLTSRAHIAWACVFLHSSRHSARFLFSFGVLLTHFRLPTGWIRRPWFLAELPSSSRNPAFLSSEKDSTLLSLNSLVVFPSCWLFY